MGIETYQKFYAADIASIAATANSAASDVISVPANSRRAFIQFYFTGNAAGSGNATATIVASMDGATFESVGTPLVAMIVSGARRSNIMEFDVEGIRALKVITINNGDPAQTITVTNAIVSFY